MKDYTFIEENEDVQKIGDELLNNLETVVREFVEKCMKNNIAPDTIGFLCLDSMNLTLSETLIKIGYENMKKGKQDN